MVDGPDAGLALFDDLAAAGELAGYHLLAATRADLLRRTGDTDGAVRAYREAFELATTDTERAYLRARREEL
jgi:RNA polymerase sigma-70 factor, ECF subfamily